MVEKTQVWLEITVKLYFLVLGFQFFSPWQNTEGEDVACAASTQEDWLRKRNETQEENIWYILSVLLLFGWEQNCSSKREEQSSTEWKIRESILPYHQQTNAFYSPSCAFGECFGSRASPTVCQGTMCSSEGVSKSNRGNNSWQWDFHRLFGFWGFLGVFFLGGGSCFVLSFFPPHGLAELERKHILFLRGDTVNVSSLCPHLSRKSV